MHYISKYKGYASNFHDNKIMEDAWKYLKEIVNLSAWNISEGDFTLLHENWTSKGVLSELLHKRLHNEGIDESMRSFLRNSYEPYEIDGRKDIRKWPHSSSRDFTIKSYTELKGSVTPDNTFKKNGLLIFLPGSLYACGYI